MTDWLNNNAGVIAALGLLSSISIPLLLNYFEERKRRKEMEDELESMKHSGLPTMSHEQRESSKRKYFLEKQLGKR